MRKTIRTPGDMLRRAAQCLKAARTLTLEARDSYHHESEEYAAVDWRQRDLMEKWSDIKATAMVLDVRDSKRRAAQKKKAQRAA